MMYTVRTLLWFLCFWLFSGESMEAQSRGSPRIVDGTPVDASEFPWIASLYIADPNCGPGMRSNHFCGGSIFDTTTGGKSWLLTASHCLDGIHDTLAYMNSAYAGYNCHFHMYADVTRDDADDPNETGYSTIKIKGWKMHEEYNSNTTSNDVAIGWSNDQLTIDPVSLKTSSPCCESDEVLRAIGYGADHTYGGPTDTLEYVDVQFVDYDTCEAMMDDNHYPGEHMHPGMLCTYYSGQSPCYGDSGGPLLQGTTSDSPQVGVVSWGYGGCAAEGLPTVFADVGYYYDWIIDSQTYVVITPTTTSITEEPLSTDISALFICDDGCSIFASYVGDYYCDCAECEDEPNWSCDSCAGGCPVFCGGYEDCGGSSSNSSTGFTCDDGCEIDSWYYNDGDCDCSDCEDEPGLSCESCPGCPSICGDFVSCNGNSSVPVFTCDDGCDIDEAYVDDNVCDCTECEDEPSWSCSSCGGCPAFCGDYSNCGNNTRTPNGSKVASAFISLSLALVLLCVS